MKLLQMMVTLSSPRFPGMAGMALGAELSDLALTVQSPHVIKPEIIGSKWIKQLSQGHSYRVTKVTNTKKTKS